MTIKAAAASASVILSLAVATLPAHSAGAGSTELQSVLAEMQAMRSELRTVNSRLAALEATNSSLQDRNQQLEAVVERREAEVDYLKSQTQELRKEGAEVAADLDKVKGADWATRIKLRGDLRVRSEMVTQERVVNGTAEDAADRSRARFRARFGFDAQVTDHSKVVMQLASGGDDPRSSNQTFTDVATRKGVGVDLAYADWRFVPGANLTLGKSKYPFWRPAQSFIYDADFNPEGGAVAFERGALFGSTYGWWLAERFNSAPEANNADTILLGAQLGLKFPLLGGESRFAVHYYDLGGGQYSNPFYAGNPFGNTTITQGSGTTAIQVLKYDYDVLLLSGEMGLAVGELPLSLWAEYGRNLAPDVEYDTTWAMGATLGKAGSPQTWELGLLYESMDKDAMFAQIIDSDFGDGTTDIEGWALRGGYAPVKNVTLFGTYMMNTRNKDVGVELDYERLQLDVNYRF